MRVDVSHGHVHLCLGRNRSGCRRHERPLGLWLAGSLPQHNSACCGGGTRSSTSPLTSSLGCQAISGLKMCVMPDRTIDYRSMMKYTETDFTEETTPLTTKSEKRSRNVERESLDTAEYINTVASSKEALIASTFFVFDTLGKSGLTASEVVAVMLEQALPGLKEGGARHTVQVANVLRRSRHFLSIGNKQYLPCSGVIGQASKSKPACKLYDRSGWHCPRDSHPGLSLCVHHLDMINRPLGNLQAPTSPPHLLPQQEATAHELLEDRELTPTVTRARTLARPSGTETAPRAQLRPRSGRCCRSCPSSSSCQSSSSTTAQAHEQFRSTNFFFLPW